MTISEIRALDEAAVKAMAIEALEIKGHTVYLADLGGYFGYSALELVGREREAAEFEAARAEGRAE